MDRIDVFAAMYEELASHCNEVERLSRDIQSVTEEMARDAEIDTAPTKTAPTPATATAISRALKQPRLVSSDALRHLRHKMMVVQKCTKQVIECVDAVIAPRTDVFSEEGKGKRGSVVFRLDARGLVSEIKVVQDTRKRKMEWTNSFAEPYIHSSRSSIRVESIPGTPALEMESDIECGSSPGTMIDLGYLDDEYST